MTSKHSKTRRCLSYRGQALPEYALILVLVSLFCFATLQITGVRIDKFFNNFADRFASLSS